MSRMNAPRWWGDNEFARLTAPAGVRVSQMTLPPIAEVEREKLQEVI
jgi:hypothetical protein